MGEEKNHQVIRSGLRELLEPTFAGIEIEVSASQRWGRTALTFRHPKFADLLPEQRFRSLMQLIPPEFYERHLRGAVWFELAPGETPEEITRAKRSEDVAADEPRIAGELLASGFFDALHVELGESPIETCGGDFSRSRRVLAGLGITGDAQRDACLVFLRQGAYCDCEVLLAARPALAEQYAGK